MGTVLKENTFFMQMSTSKSCGITHCLLMKHPRSKMWILRNLSILLGAISIALECPGHLRCLYYSTPFGTASNNQGSTFPKVHNRTTFSRLA